MTEKSKNTAPIPQGLYVAAKRHGAMIFTSGMTPRKDGVLMQAGQIKADVPIENYREAVLLASRNALEAARSILYQDEIISGLLNLTVFIAADSHFTVHSKIADFASEFFRLELKGNGIGTRAAVGVSTLPGNATVEIQAVFSV